MKTRLANLREPDSFPLTGQQVITAGRIIAVDNQGKPTVDFPGAPPGGAPAKVAAPAGQFPASGGLIELPVVILLRDGDVHSPIILNVIRDSLPDPDNLEWANPARQTLNVNGKRLILEGDEEIILKCGRSSITLRADGQIVLKGARLLSKASEINKIRGASVQIN